MTTIDNGPSTVWATKAQRRLLHGQRCGSCRRRIPSTEPMAIKREPRIKQPYCQRCLDKHIAQHTPSDEDPNTFKAVVYERMEFLHPGTKP